MMRIPKYYRIAMFIFFLGFGTELIFAQARNERLEIFDRSIAWSDGNNMLIRHLNSQAFDYLDVREKEVGALNTQAEWVKRQQKVKDILVDLVGPFPEKTPLNPKITGVIEKDDFKVEKILYESMPGLYVTAAMFIPNGLEGKSAPAVIYVSGHSFSGSKSSTYQHVMLNLVKKGFIVLAFDPLDQGERIQYWDEEEQKSLAGNSPTQGHNYFGEQMFLSGVSANRYFIWDGMRAVDYLLTREEVDPDRIGITGRSGGGTQSAMIAAFDDRIYASAPENYLTNFRRLIQTMGAQDAEQLIYHGIKHGIDHADLLSVRAPKPSLMITTMNDMFSIQGAKETYDEVTATYKAFGKAENIRMAEDIAGHSSTKNNREAMYAFFQKHLNNPGSPEDLDVETFESEELYVTPTGQLSTSIGGDIAYDVNKRNSEKLIHEIEASRKIDEEYLNQVSVKAKELSGYIEPHNEVEYFLRGKYQRDGYSIETYALPGEREYVIPLLLFIPDSGDNLSSVIYLNPDGKLADAAPGGKIEQLVNEGNIVAAPDVIGVGELRDSVGHSQRASHHLALMLGRSVLGIQAGDVVRVANFLKSRPDVNNSKINGIAFDALGPTLLHAASFNNSINSISLVGSLISYESMVTNKNYNWQFTKYYVPGALTAYDLADLMATIAPRKIALVGLKDQMKEPVSKNQIDKELAFPINVYSQMGVPDNIEILPATENIDSLLIGVRNNN